MSQKFFKLVGEVAFGGILLGIGEVIGRIKYGSTLPTNREMATIVVKNSVEMVAFPVMIPYNLYWIYKYNQTTPSPPQYTN